MAHLIEVAFKGNRKDFFIWEPEDAPTVKAAVIVEADRGEDLGRVHAVGELAARRNAGAAHGYGAALPAQRAWRLATRQDMERHAELRAQDEDARKKAAERVIANALTMKVSDAEWQWDRKKLTFYFTAEKRVDFRTLVRELASMFRTRIELKQIGVRDEAKRLDGIGRCGRQYCSASWLPELRPVNLGVAKDQRLSLNPTQISGACGRLMCCLRYEHDFYVESRKRFPKEGKILTLAHGEEKVLANDIFRERVTLRTSEGETRVVSLAALQAELHGVDPLAALPTGPDTGEFSLAAMLGRDASVFELEEVVARTTRAPAPPPTTTTTTPPPSDASAETEASPEGPAPEDSERRPHRRRGRRGGRRNKGSGPKGDSSPPASPPAPGA